MSAPMWVRYTVVLGLSLAALVLVQPPRPLDALPVLGAAWALVHLVRLVPKRPRRPRRHPRPSGF